ncbi:MAG: cytochrome c [Bdellovibrionales bacterium]|nr:cytochrome c [Bdellovibrionales bacterium]
MKKILFCFLLSLFISTLRAEELIAEAVYVDQPVKNKAGKSVIKLRNAKEDLYLDFDKLDKKTQNLIKNTDPKKALNITYPREALDKKIEPPMGIRADCSEIPTNMDELGVIAQKSNNMVDFLNKIPQGSLQGFTFVTNSLSLHRGKKDKDGEGIVSPMWPRVLRSSADGKLTVSFVCDPKNPTFGKVEIIHFDDKEKEFKTTEFDFGHPSGPAVPPTNRIHKDPVSCISCHAGSEINGKVSLKPNWPEYFQWSDCRKNRGIQFYGGNDDNMGIGSFRVKYDNKNGCSAKENEIATALEKSNYKKFRQMQKGNECFNSLPWPKNPKPKSSGSKDFSRRWTYDYYPYSDSGQDVVEGFDSTGEGLQNYALRTNLRFTDTYSHLMSQRIANLLKKNSNYDIVKYLLVMEQAGCVVSPSELKAVNELIPGSKLKLAPEAGATDSESSTPLLFSFAKMAGLNKKDWTMEFQEKKSTDYSAGMPNTVTFDSDFSGDLTINRVVAGEILKDISKDDEKIAASSKGKITRGVTEFFGNRFSCIDDLGGGINNQIDSPSGVKFCNDLRSANKNNIAKVKEIQENCTDCKKISLPEVKRDLANTIEKTVEKLSADQIARGKKLVEADSRGKCVTCHSASVDLLPKDFRFIPSETDPKKKESVAVMRARKNEIADKLNNRLIKTKTMPPPPLGSELSDQDRADVNAYLLNLAVKGK